MRTILFVSLKVHGNKEESFGSSFKKASPIKMETIVDHYEREGIEALKRVDLMNLANDLYYELLFVVMYNNDTEAFSCIPLRFNYSSYLQKVLQISRELCTTKFVQLLIKKTIFVTILFEVVERNNCFRVEDVCTVLLAYQELGLLSRIEQLHSQEEKVIEALKRITCDVWYKAIVLCFRSE